MPTRQTSMRFDDQFIAELKARLVPSTVIGRTVKLQRRGHEYVGLSPFTKEKTPSFSVNDEKGFFHCFSSGKHGDVIAFVQETERLSFPEAVRRLAEEAGMEPPALDARSARSAKNVAELAMWLERAADWYETQLHGAAGGPARAYLAARGLPEAVWRLHRLGYAPKARTALKDHLTSLGAPVADLAAAGLIIAPCAKAQAYDRFRDRIMFPILDASGRLVSFGGRALGVRASAKYLNGPETRLFTKGRILYGLPEARRLLGRGRPGEPAAPVVVEGYFDVVACHRAGVPAVAPMGATLSEAQMEALWRLHREPVLSFDGDAAGDRAAERVIDRALPLIAATRSFRFARLPAGRDPDELYREQGPDGLRAALAAPRPLADVIFAQEHDREPLDTPERRVAFAQRLHEIVGRITDADFAEAYERAFRAKLGQHRRIEPPPFAAALALAALDHPGWASAYAVRLAQIGFGHPRLAPAAEAVVDALKTGAVAREQLAARGLAALVKDLEEAAVAAAPPFLDPRLDDRHGGRLWQAGYEALSALQEPQA